MPARKKHHTIGVFESKARAEQAIADLRAAGFEESKIGMVYRDAAGKTVKTGAADETHAEEGAIAGALAGATGGALVGAGILAGVIPVIGPVLALGTLGTVLVNAAGGAALIGLAGALVGWGIPEEDAEFYEREVENGRYLVTVDANGRGLEARDIMHRRSGFDRQGWTAVRADRANIVADGRFEAQDGRVIQLREEQLRANTEEIETGSVSVRKEVHTEQRQLTVPVEHEEVVIERRPATGTASGEIRAEEIRIPVKEERVRVTKEPVVTEEVTVGKRKVRENRTVSGTVRKEEAVVESEGGAKVRQTVKAGKK
ncbi:YsnF/AvaK domain-containing protein [Gemmata sp. G18]|uniref:YsnF/AvaK domain-containing protein n=1 Tax=Gemmata palustris TaxID=2822762 RepID=A0ABS5BW23_9BACT|nr:YsnF/AvaK domain-containing protein [Gemmata palustris]MBP3957440.1 YsnF/AvaK domain-containing protein [Gemmata palustris]